MSIQKFPLPALQKIRSYIQTALALPPSEQEAQMVTQAADLPEPESLDDLSNLFKYGGLPQSTLSIVSQPKWFISTVNPTVALKKLPGVKVKPELRLVAYLYRFEKSGVGLVWAVPEPLSTTAHLEKALAASGGMSQFPKPEGALAHFAEAFEGDRSPASFLIASILRRELQELGALGERLNWKLHVLIDAAPSNISWRWQTNPAPSDLAPKVRIFPDGRVAVEFFTCRMTAPKTLYRHLDQYPAEHYKANSVDKAVAIAS